VAFNVEARTEAPRGAREFLGEVPSDIDGADMMDAVLVHHSEAFSFRRRSMAQPCSSEMA